MVEEHEDDTFHLNVAVRLQMELKNVLDPLRGRAMHHNSQMSRERTNDIVLNWTIQFRRTL